MRHCPAAASMYAPTNLASTSRLRYQTSGLVSAAVTGLRSFLRSAPASSCSDKFLTVVRCLCSVNCVSTEPRPATSFVAVTRSSTSPTAMMWFIRVCASISTGDESGDLRVSRIIATYALRPVLPAASVAGVDPGADEARSAMICCSRRCENA